MLTRLDEVDTLAPLVSVLDECQLPLSYLAHGQNVPDDLQRLIDGAYPDERGRYGEFGGRFVPETLVPAVTRLEQCAREALSDRAFRVALGAELRDFVGRPTPLTPAPRLSSAWDAEVWLKREDLAHTGAHKINNALGQALLAKRMGKPRVIA